MKPAVQKKHILFTISLVMLVPAISHAAGVFFEAPARVFAPNEEFEVSVFLDGTGTSVNAAEGTVRFPNDLLELKEVRDGNSAMNFWIQRPQAGASDSVAFSGITAGGFSGPRNPLFSMIFRAKRPGLGSIRFEESQAFQNDGLGTKLPISSAPFAVSISNSRPASTIAITTFADSDQPEAFRPYIGSDPTVFSGRYFLVFSTQDKGSGIDHYEVKEGQFGSFSPAVSPYELKDQSLSKTLYVKAVDKKGNEIVVAVGAYNPGWLYQYILIAVILMALGLFAYKKRWFPFTKK